MQTPKYLLMLCFVALGFNTLYAQRPDTEEQAKARALLRQKMDELNTHKEKLFTQPAPVVTARPVAPAQPAAPAAFTPPKAVAAPQPFNLRIIQDDVPVSAPQTAVVPAPGVTKGRLSLEEEAKARMALHEKVSEVDPASRFAPPAGPGRALIGDRSGLSTLIAPQPPIPTGLSSAKEQSLAELLTRYRADAITPEEYHKRRAEILAK